MNWKQFYTRLNCRHVAQADHAKGYVCTKCGKGLWGPETTLLGEIISRYFAWLLLCIGISVVYFAGEWSLKGIAWCWARLDIGNRTEDTLLWLQDRPVLLILTICAVAALIGTIMTFVLRGDEKPESRKEDEK